LVLAADLGEAARPPATPRPALSTSDVAPQLERIEDEIHAYRLTARPQTLTLRPYFAQYDRRTAPYLKQLTDVEWDERQASFATEEAARAALDARTVDRIELGEAASETTHAYRANHDDLFSYEGVAGRQAPWGVGNYFEFELAIEPGTLSLHALYWGEEINKDFEIKIDGATLVRERRPGPAVRSFVAQEYALPRALIGGKSRIAVRFETRGTDALVYGVRVLRAA
jgi:hypothetical protein